ncbi:hypothetical protein PYCCODRAFT_1153768 [Trametes coccinea BRFM310]|uniref:Uncharacterized protein n=1 Tax=Trametes coccinea (strain BRFM310) TaxID=1353009 RepID=A0A1Y2IWR2_TRAC3|nr:hypothetical protein PYCCODRAFT_1153768 [Trametes coccinea BRFM310]
MARRGMAGRGAPSICGWRPNERTSERQLSSPPPDAQPPHVAAADGACLALAGPAAGEVTTVRAWRFLFCTCSQPFAWGRAACGLGRAACCWSQSIC